MPDSIFRFKPAHTVNNTGQFTLKENIVPKGCRLADGPAPMGKFFVDPKWRLRGEGMPISPEEYHDSK